MVEDLGIVDVVLGEALLGQVGCDVEEEFEGEQRFYL